MPLQLPPPPPAQPAGGGTSPPRPLTHAEVIALEQRQEALLMEQASVRAQRDAAFAELQTVRASPMAGRAGRMQHAFLLEQEIAQLDGRLVRIEADLQDVGRRLTGQLVASDAAPPPPPPPIQPGLPDDAIIAIGIVAVVVFLAPISLAIARLIWKWGTAVRSPQTWDSESRLDRVDHSLDAIAVEVERISEGQRYVTHLLTESPNFVALGEGSRAGEVVPQREGVKDPRGER